MPFDEDFEAIIKDIDIFGTDNIQRRIIHSQLSLLEQAILSTKSQPISKTDTNDALLLQINKTISELDLRPVGRKSNVLNQIELLIRFCGVVGAFILLGLFGAPFILLFRQYDSIARVAPFDLLSEKIKRSFAWGLLFLSGIEVDVIGLDKAVFKNSSVLLAFSHASNFDGFLVSGTCPVRNYALAKKELFLVPFFSWISLAFGGVPVDRENRERAVGALKRSANSAKGSNVCVVIAPEGTRSVTGQLLPFKKGAFHMWDTLQSPMVPVIIFGAYDLYPVKSWINRTGRVTVLYLNPIDYPSQDISVEDKMIMVRSKMLEAIRDQCPKIGEDA
eukprot:gene8630-11663_t